MLQRREFFKLMAAAGMTASLPVFSTKVQAAPLNQFLVVVNAGGGWDPTSLIDPKGLNAAYPERAVDGYDGSVNKVALNPANRVGDIQWSDVPRINNDDATSERVAAQYANFFAALGDKLIAINGIDYGTNNHDSGNRATWSGKLDMGYPSMAALYAAQNAPGLPMSYISNGGYDFTAGLVARTRANNANYLNELSDPNAVDANNGFFYRDKNGHADTYSIIENAQQARLNRQKTNETMPLRRSQINQLFTVRNASSDLSQMKSRIDLLNTNLVKSSTWFNRADSLKSQAQVVSAAFAAGLAASANLSMGGFDTHGNHDNSHFQSMGDLLEGIHYLMLCLQEMGVADKTTVLVGSDFGRTPYYNSGNGKDHWQVTSMLAIMPYTTGGKVFGATDERFNARKVNLQTGLPDNNGEVLTPAIVQKQMRKLVGITNSSLLAAYPLAGSDANIFGAV